MLVLVGASHSIAEPIEHTGRRRNRPALAWGEKGLRQEELGRANHVPDTEPDTRHVPCARTGATKRKQDRKGHPWLKERFFACHNSR